MPKPRGKFKKKKTPPPDRMAKIVAAAADDMKARDIVVLKIAGLVVYADYMVVCSGNSARQAQAIADNIEKAIRENGSKPIGVEGMREGNWILVDWGDVVAHVFHHPVREFYEIEKIWAGAEELDWSGETGEA